MSRPRFLEWAVVPSVALVVLGLAIWALMSAVPSPLPQVIVSYSVLPIERVDPNTGIVMVPVVPGYNGPAIPLGSTIPIRGTVSVQGTQEVKVTQSLVWEQVPRGLRVVSRADYTTTLAPGVTDLTFEEQIPEEVILSANEDGAHLWRVVSVVNVHAPHAVDAGWTTAPFWIVP